MFLFVLAPLLLGSCTSSRTKKEVVLYPKTFAHVRQDVVFPKILGEILNRRDYLADKAIRFSPVYGTGRFEAVDYDGDGDQDFITVHGDNADKSYVHKPYHGMRIHLNDGNANFEEAYFFPLYGATRVIASDFDLDRDGDGDLVLSSFTYYFAPVPESLGAEWNEHDTDLLILENQSNPKEK